MGDSALRRTIFHGAVVIWLGLLAGIPFIFVILGTMDGEVRAWRMAHLEGVLNGLVMLAVAGFWDKLTLDERKQRTLSWALVATGYGNVTASILGALSGQRGLELVLPISNLVVFGLFTVAIVGIFTALVLVMVGARGRAA